MKGVPQLPIHPPEFVPHGRLTRERYLEIPWNPDNFLWEDEVKLLVWVIGQASDALSWEVQEMGSFKDEYFDPVIIPTIPHKPWQEKNRPLAPGARDEVRRIVKDRMDAGVYEYSSASYRSNIFAVPKSNGALRVVHDNQELNRVSIRDAALPPHADHIVEAMSGRAIYSTLDLHVAFDQRKLAEESRDMTSFHSPYGLLRCTRLLMGHTNSFQILHADMDHIFSEKKAEGKTETYCDDLIAGGPRTRYELAGGGYLTIPDNPGIRQFVWDHLQDLLEILWTAKAYGITFSGGRKLKVARATAKALGHTCTYEGRSPEEEKKSVILDWGQCRDVTDVRKFLGTAGVLRMFVRSYSIVARPLINLTKKFAEFLWGPEQQRAMLAIKEAIREAPCLAPIDYASDEEVILGVDSSEHGVGWYLAQKQPDGKRRYCRFGSASFTEVQGRYGQSKCELFGLYVAFTQARFWLFGVRNLVVEHDARYLKGMVENPDRIPDAVMNRWIAGIRLFTFRWQHIPGKAHEVADGLSRRVPAPGEQPVNPRHCEADEYVERVYGLALTVKRSPGKVLEDPREKELSLIRQLLSKDNWKQVVKRMPSSQGQRILSYAGRFRLIDGVLYIRGRTPENAVCLLVVPQRDRRDALISEFHDDLGHKGVFSVFSSLRVRFWWPGMQRDIAAFIKSCDPCQRRNEKKPVIARRTPEVPGPLRKWHVDTKFMPKSKGYSYILQARCALTGYPEIRAVRKENHNTISSFISEDLIRRYGPCITIVTDNGAPYVKALDLLTKKWPSLQHVRITPYNSQANGIVERAHRTLQESLFKVATAETWAVHLDTVVMAERMAVRQSLGTSPFYLAHGIAPTLPADLTEYTMLAAAIEAVEQPEELLAARIEAQPAREAELDKVAESVHKRREAENERQNTKAAGKIKEFKPGDLVMVRDATRESRHDSKPDDRYNGPYVVTRRGKNGVYTLVELAAPMSPPIRIGGRRVGPYHSREDHTREVELILAENEASEAEHSTDASEDEEDLIS